MWLQDGDPSQNSSVARAAWSSMGAELFRIPARSPDVNPIEDLFKIVKNRLQKDALKKNITRESFEEFSKRVRQTILNIDTVTIDKIIASMNKRIDLIIIKKGGRTKY